MRDYIEIFRRNLLSPVVVAIYLLAVALLLVHEYRDAWFISFVITVNVAISIIQEVRAKRALKKLELMSAPHARLIQGDGSVKEIAYSELKVNDMIRLLPGDELPADAEIVANKGLELNEGMLTGESLSIERSVGDIVYAATIVTAGEATARVVSVGDNTKAGSISKTLKRYTPELTPLQSIIQQAISWLTYGAVILSALIFVVYSLHGHDSIIILRTITSAAVTVIPEGLLLGSSLLLAFGSLKLARANVLPQKLSAIEAMALLNLLCVDKTGTLTNDKITLERVESFGKQPKKEIGKIVALVAKETSGGNNTGKAILDKLTPVDAKVCDVMAFSSERKMAGVRATIDNKTRTFVMGAPEFVMDLAKIQDKDKKQIDKWTSEGLRVLVLAEFGDNKTNIKKMPQNSGNIIGAVLLNNALRDGVVDTVNFLQGQNVGIRVISGDNPKTVQYIAGLAGIDNPTKSITGAELAKLSDGEFNRAADNNTIFARVLPEQKERLITHFRLKGLFTGMVGDGVNDALALKRADLGVAMYSGAPAARRVSDIILLDDSFNSLPLGMKLGNRIMQAIELIAVLFFHKIIFGVILLLSTMALGMVYPFAPRHNTFMNIFLVTMPTIMWTMFPPSPHHRVNPKNFWRDTLQSVAPIAVITGLTVTFTYWILSIVYHDRPATVTTMTVLTATFFGVYLVFLAGKMLGVTLNKLSLFVRALYLIAVTVVSLAAFGTQFLRKFFDFDKPQIWILWPAIGVIVLAAIVQWQLAKQASKRFANTIK